jgi:hypothetical protein
MNRKIDAQDILRHPFVITLSIIAIAYGGYLFGQWLRASGV